MPNWLLETEVRIMAVRFQEQDSNGTTSYNQLTACNRPDVAGTWGFLVAAYQLQSGSTHACCLGTCDEKTAT